MRVEGHFGHLEVVAGRRALVPGMYSAVDAEVGHMLLQMAEVEEVAACFRVSRWTMSYHEGPLARPGPR